MGATKKIDLRGNRLDWKGLEAIVDNMDPFLLKLNLADNNFGVKGYELLTDWILSKSKGYLNHLNLAGNRLSLRIAPSFFDSIYENGSYIMNLNLSDTNLTGVMIDDLTKVIIELEQL